MNKKNKIKFLSAAACLAVVGTASAAWVFAQSASKTDYIGNEIAGVTYSGSVEISGITDDSKLKLDTARTVSTPDSVEGISWISCGAISADYIEPVDDAIRPQYMVRTYTIELSTELAEYVEFVDAGANSEGAKGATSDVDAPNASYTASKVSGYWADGKVITMPTVHWKAGKNPTTADEYNAMKEKLADKKITVIFKADTPTSYTEANA